MNVRAKFKVASVKKFADYPMVEIELSAIFDNSTEENRRFTKYTPSGKLVMTVTNPAVIDEMQPGKIYYLDFTEADAK